jgi:tetratricopeptide (TPR) repeat protein
MGEHDAEYWFAKAEELEKQAEYLDDIEQIVAQQEKRDEAMEAYSRGLELSPTNYYALERLLYLSRRARDNVRAEAAMKRVIFVRPKDEELLTALMWNLRGQGKKEEADTVKARIDALETDDDPEARALNLEIEHYTPDPEDPDDLDPITRLMEEDFADEEPASSSLPTKPKKPNIMDMFETDEDVEEIEGSLFDTDYPVEKDEKPDTTKESEVDRVTIDAILNYGRVDEPQEEKEHSEEEEDEDFDDLEDLFG